MIGSFAFTATASNKYVAKQVTDSARMIGEYNSNVSKAFAELDKLAIERKNKFLGGKIVKVKGTSIMTLKMPSAQAHNEAMRTLREKEEMQNWMMNWSSSDEVIQKIVVPTSEATLEDSSLKEQQTVKHLRSVKRTRVVKPLRRAVTHPLENLLNALGNICKKRLIAVEIIGKGKPVKTRYVRRNDCTYIKVATKHERGIKRKRDVDISAWSRALLKTLIHKTHGAKKHHTSSFDRGSSGLALLNSVLSGPRSAGRGGVFVVRGKCGDKLYDSQSIVTMGTTNEMIHYSVSDRFWKGYNQGFQDHKPVVNHKCESNLDVEECGVVAAIATQALFPCGRITCEQCIEQFLKEGKDELRDQHSGTLSKLIGEVQVKHPKFLHVVKFLSLFNDFLNFRNDNIAHYAETNRIIGERKETPFKQLSELNDLLIKIGECTNEEVRQGTTRILELSRFQRNRTDNIASGSLSHFRNKVSSKVHVNLDLMCDNQLDDDGNFKWRQRAYHAKRLISNFFELVDPEKGYDAYVHRINPNGVRKTAIGKLIVSTNMQTFRKQMRGEPIESMPLSNSCVSRLKGGFVYPCCCVT
ncbi:hypothetical protein, partial [Ralstonia pseudosolanacearum]|uniref:hypothetical protein n=1 Tax=Ralstonia pseudosolanacearum TaxID=1310165 RepID=UPI003D18157D